MLLWTRHIAQSCGVSFIIQNCLFKPGLWWKISGSVNSCKSFLVHAFETIPMLLMNYYGLHCLLVRLVHYCKQRSYALLEIISCQHKVTEHLLNSISSERRGKTRQYKYCFMLKTAWTKIVIKKKNLQPFKKHVIKNTKCF